MMPARQYRRLQELVIHHEYYGSAFCTGLVCEPSTQFARVLRQSGVLWRQTQGGFLLIGDENSLERLQAISTGMVYVIAKDPDMSVITVPEVQGQAAANTAPSPGVSEHWYFTHDKKPAFDSGIAVAGIVSPIFNLQFDHEDDNTIVVVSRVHPQPMTQLRRLQSLAIRTGAFEQTIDLADEPDGLYRVQWGPADAGSTRYLYVSSDAAQTRQVVCVIHLDFTLLRWPGLSSVTQDSALISLNLELQSRALKWSYIVRLSDSGASPKIVDQRARTLNGFVIVPEDDSLDRISFTHKVLENGDVRFESKERIPLRQITRKNLVLSYKSASGTRQHQVLPSPTVRSLRRVDGENVFESFIST